MMEIREKESPARTIDSTGSTAASMETIVDLNSSYNSNQDKIQTQQSAMENSTNTTNCNKNSLTNSQISMISSNEQNNCNNFNNNNTMDPQHHIYTSPDLVLGGQKTDKKFSVKKFKEELVPIKSSDDDINNKKKLEILKSKGKSLDLISTKSSISQKTTKKPQQSFPIYIILGILQLVLSISLVALGCLLIIRDAGLSTIGSGIWSGGIAAIAGALGVINLSKSRAGFLAVSLICVASSTLAIALTGTGLVRDISRWDQNQEFNILNTEAAVSAGCGLIFALGLHLIISIISVYKSAIKLCSRNPNEGSNKQMLDNIITVTNSSMGLNQQKLEEYINNMSASDKEKMLLPENIDKLMAMWMYSSKRPHQRPAQPKRPIVLVPASAGNGLQMLPPGCRTPHGIIIPPPAVIPPYSMHPPPIVGRLPQPPPPGSIIFPDGSCRISRPASEIVNRYHYPPNKQKRSGRHAANKRQRRKSDTDAENQKAFIYTGLDRSIADSFLERQEQSNCSHIDYSSSNESYQSGRKCSDVAM